MKNLVLILTIIVASITATAVARAASETEIRQQLAGEHAALLQLVNDLSGFSSDAREHALVSVPAVIAQTITTIEQFRNVRAAAPFKKEIDEIMDLIAYELPLRVNKLDASTFSGFLTQLFSVLEQKASEHFEKHMAYVQRYAAYKKLDAESTRDLLSQIAKKDAAIDFDRSIAKRLRYTLGEVIKKNEQRSAMWRRIAMRGVGIAATAAGAYLIGDGWSATWGGVSMLAGIMTFVGAKYPSLFQGLSRSELIDEIRALAQKDREKNQAKTLTACAVLLSSPEASQENLAN